MGSAWRDQVRRPWVAWGRAVKPAAVAIAMADATISAAYVANTGVLGDNPWADLAAVFAGVAVLLLVAGWCWPSTRLLIDGLAVSAGVWAYLASLNAFTIGLWHPATWLALAWTVAAAGSARLELRERWGIDGP